MGATSASENSLAASTVVSHVRTCTRSSGPVPVLRREQGRPTERNGSQPLARRRRMDASVGSCVSGSSPCRRTPPQPRRAPRRESVDTMRWCGRVPQPVLTPRSVKRGDASNVPPTLGAPRLQGLFHSLSKVLCIFRSHYLFAIGLGALFSLRRMYTCGFAQHYQTARLLVSQGSIMSPPCACRPSRDLRPPRCRFPASFVCLLEGLPEVLGPCTTIPQLPVPSAADSTHRLFPLHSPLLGESPLFSCPPLNDMLKFSGSS